jgi:amino acid adenylation domain-containing protein
MPIIDLGKLPEVERDDEARRLAWQQNQRPFDLTQGPLLRSTLLQLHADRYVLALTLHHIIADGWSMRVLFRELEALYNAYVAGAPAPLPALSIHYADYAHWQRQWLQGDALTSHLSYWKTQLADIPAGLELPTDWPRAALQTHRGARLVAVLAEPLTEALKVLSRQAGATLFMTLLAAFKTLLHRSTAQEHIVVGTPMAGRNRVELEGLIGCFLNTLVLHTDLSDDPTFREALHRVREVTLGAFTHQELPFEKLVEMLEPERDLRQNPLFQIFFNMLNLEANDLHLTGMTAAPFVASEPASKFDMTLYVSERQSTLHVQCVYNAELFSEARMHEMLAQFRELLRQVVEDPDRRLSSYSLVTAEARAVLPDPHVRLPEPYYEPVTHWFMHCAQRAPSHVAVVHGTHLWPYETLAQRAEALARTLIGRGLTRQEVVAVRVPPSFGMVVSMLGVLMSGGVFLLIDPDLPSERQQLVWREAQARYLIETAGSASADAGLAMLPGLERLTLDATTGRLEAAAVGMDGAHLPRLAPDDAAYIFFTSGSTGVPKGVLGCHKGLSHFVHWQADTFDVGPDDRVAQLTRLSFDPVLRDVFLPLTRGATLCIPDTYGALGPHDLVRWLAQERITIVHTVPTLAQSWLTDMPGDVPCPDLRRVFFSGEALTDTLVHRWRARFPGCDVVNLYGPTETTMVKGFYKVPQDLRPGVQPIGSPIPQTQLLVFTPHRQLCGIGEPGEIVIRTPFRSLGYVNASDQDQQRFAVHPLSHDPQDVVYYTGDRGRYRPDGTLEIMGRLDDQVKIRGVRVEPGEVTATLSHHPAVQACAVVARKQATGQNGLVAYVVPTTPGGIRESALRSYLVEHLPLVMLPAVFVVLDALPLTATGKVDLQALPEPEPVTSGHTAAYVPPQSALEQTLAEIWAELLGIERVGGDDNFFALGGHSLLATQVVSRVRHQVNVDVPLRTLFQVPTLAALAEQIEVLRQTASRASEPPLTPVPRDGAVPLSFAQQRLWFLEQFAPGGPVYHISHAFRLYGALNRVALTQSLNHIVRRHEALRTTFVVVDQKPRQSIRPWRAVEMPCIDLRGLADAERPSELQRLAREAIQRPFDLRRDVLLRATLLQVAEDEHVLLLVVHHIVADGWSMGILFRELSVLYNAFCHGQSSPLSPLPLQYADFAIWQRQWLQGAVLDHQLAYWQQQLGNAPAALAFPTDYPRPAVQSHRGAMQDAILPATLVNALEALSHQEHVTMFMTLLATLKMLLYRITGQEDLVVGAPISGRNRSEIEGLIGFFLNTLALRTKLSRHISFRTLLGQVREVTLEAYNHQDIPFEKLVKELRVVRDTSRTPLFQVFLNMLNFEDTQLELHGLRLEPLRRFVTLAKFDMTFYARQRHGQMLLRLVYNADLFRPERMAELLAQFQHLLSQVVDHPDQPLTAFSLALPTTHKRLPPPTHAPGAAWPDPVHAAGSGQAHSSPQHLASVVSQTWLEETLTGIWSEVLGLEHIGIHDNFFALGGHSLMAVQLVSKMSGVMHREISIQTLFTYQTIAELLGAMAAEAAETHGAHDMAASCHGNSIPPEDLKDTAVAPDSPYLTIERRPLLPLVIMGKLPPVDAAALSCLSSELLVRTGLRRDQIVTAWCDGLPTLSTLREMPLGRIATIMLPRFQSELYDDQGALVEEIIEALQLAGRLGAKTVSLTGLIPSATDYGRAVLEAIGGRADFPQVSTGHATTATTVVLAIARIVRAAGRDLRHERVGFLGLGSIGQTTLRLLLQCLPHPREIVLCDVYSKLEELAHIRQQLVAQYGFQGEIRTCGSGQHVPPALYTSSLIVGATNVPELLDIALLSPGTLLVDDSAPHCFAVDAAVERLETHGDILFTEGGVLRAPYPIHQWRYISESMQQMRQRANRLSLASHHPYQITGCVLSGLLSACFAHLKPTVGTVHDEACRQHYEQLSQLGFQAAELHCGGYVLSETTIRNFQQRCAGLAIEGF